MSVRDLDLSHAFPPERERLAYTSGELAALRAERDALRAERDELRSQLHGEVVSWHEIAAERDALRVQLDVARSIGNAAIKESDAIRRERDELRVQLHDESAAWHSLRARLEEADELLLRASHYPLPERWTDDYNAYLAKVYR